MYERFREIYIAHESPEQMADAIINTKVKKEKKDISPGATKVGGRPEEFKIKTLRFVYFVFYRPEILIKRYKLDIEPEEVFRLISKAHVGLIRGVAIEKSLSRQPEAVIKFIKVCVANFYLLACNFYLSIARAIHDDRSKLKILAMISGGIWDLDFSKDKDALLITDKDKKHFKKIAQYLSGIKSETVKVRGKTVMYKGKAVPKPIKYERDRTFYSVYMPKFQAVMYSVVHKVFFERAYKKRALAEALEQLADLSADFDGKEKKQILERLQSLLKCKR